MKAVITPDAESENALSCTKESAAKNTPNRSLRDGAVWCIPRHFVPDYFHPIPSGYPAGLHFFVSYLLRFLRLFAAIPTPTFSHDYPTS
jgi:hypothetical protein